MKSFVYGALSLLVPAALILFGLGFVSGLIAKFFGYAVIAIMIIFTHSRFISAREEENNDKPEDTCRTVLIGNAATALVYLFLLLLGSRTFYSDVAANPFTFPPLMSAVAYCCLLAIVYCIFRMITDKYLNGWEKAHFAFIIGAAFCTGFFCVYEALKPYGVHIPDELGNVFYTITIIFLTGIIVCGYRLTVYKNRL